MVPVLCLMYLHNKIVFRWHCLLCERENDQSACISCSQISDPRGKEEDEEEKTSFFFFFFFTAVRQMLITHLIQRPCYQRGSLCQDPAGNRTTRRPPAHRKKDANCSGMVMSSVHQLWPKPSCKVQWKRGRRQGRQRKRWEDNSREWAGLEFAKSQKAVESREKWRKLVAKSPVVPQRPSRLRDR